MKKVSVIIPVFNVKDYLEKCVGSILAQTYKNTEILLIDDGSTDGSSQLCDKLALRSDKVTVIHQENRGVSNARNIGIERATGDFITFVDADDYVAEVMIAELYDAISKERSDISICGTFIFRSGQQPYVDMGLFKQQTYDNNKAIKKLLYQDDITNSVFGRLYRKSLFKNVRFPEDISIGEDLDLNYSLFLCARKITVIPQKMYFYFQRDGSAMHSTFNDKRLDGLRVTQKIYDNVKDTNQELLRAAESKMFTEVVYIATAIPLAKSYTSYRMICADIITRFSSRILQDKKATPVSRLYALVGLMHPYLLLLCLRLKGILRNGL